MRCKQALPTQADVRATSLAEGAHTSSSNGVPLVIIMVVAFIEPYL
jgi:hypothetical protein